MEQVSKKNSYIIKNHRKKMIIDKFDTLIISIKPLYYNVNLVI